MQLIEPLLPITDAYRVKDGSGLRRSRRNAVAQAISIFERNRDQEISESNDPLSLFVSEHNVKWLSETVVQGAYLREYHSWEKEVKSYLNGQRHLNGEMKEFDWKRPAIDGLVTLVTTYLKDFSVRVDDRTIATINIMRVRVNSMKHTPGFFEGHLVSREEYDIAALAIEEFWKHLEGREITCSVEPGPHIDKYLETL
jgi:hypothetical protein